MTEPSTDTAPTEDTGTEPREITFNGRTMWVHLPAPEQLLVWQRTVRQLQGADVDNWDGQQVMNALERARRIIDSVLVNNIDKDWMDDEMLDGNLTIKGAAQIIQLTVEAFGQDENRETRRATKKAARKKAR